MFRVQQWQIASCEGILLPKKAGNMKRAFWGVSKRGNEEKGRWGGEVSFHLGWRGLFQGGEREELGGEGVG